MSINRLPEITFVFIVCLVDFVWKYRFGGERFPTLYSIRAERCRKRVKFFKGLHSVPLIMSQRQRKLEFFRGDSTGRDEEEEDPLPSTSTSTSVRTSREREDPNPSTSKETQR